jgi:phage terminase large subunit
LIRPFLFMRQDLKPYIEQARRWRFHPEEWVKAYWPDLALSTQQKQALLELGKLIRAKVKLADGEKLTKEEAEYSKKIGISIQSGNGTGKDAWAAIVNLFFLSSFPYPKSICTANTKQQLRNVLWSEMAKWMRLAVKNEAGISALQELFEYQAEKIYRKTEKGNEWFVEAVTINTKASEEEQAESIAGRHEDYQLVTVDEASGIADAVFKKLERTLTRRLNIFLIIFNPTRNKGYAIDSQTDPRFISLRWNAEDSELVTKEQIDSIAEKYTKESNPYRIGVLGLPPLTETNTLIPRDWIMDAIERVYTLDERDPVLKGVDVGSGGDKSVTLTRHGIRVKKITRSSVKDTMTLVGQISTEIEADDPKMTFVDIIGIGNGVYYRLRELGKKVLPVDVRRTAKRPERFQRVRDELWWTLREQFENGTISIPNDRELVNQLDVMTYEPDSTGKIKIESKKSLRTRGEHSPDEADALCMTYYLPESTFRPQEKDPYDDYKEKEPETSWMAA